MAVQEGFTQVAPDSTGDKIRTIEIDVVQPDTTTATVQMQVVNIADAEGNILGEDTPSPVKLDSETTNILNTDSVQLLSDILKELKIMNIHLSMITGNEIKRTEVE